VIGTAKRHGIQAQQTDRWRERLEPQPAPAAFLPLSVAPDPALPSPAPVLDDTRRDRHSASRLDRSPRVEIVLSAGRRIIVDEGVDTDAVLRLVRGLEALR
jgi:transposase